VVGLALVHDEDDHLGVRKLAAEALDPQPVPVEALAILRRVQEPRVAGDPHHPAAVPCRREERDLHARAPAELPGEALRRRGVEAVDKLGPEAPGSMVVMDARGQLSTVPWNYGGGWGGMVYNVHPDNYQWNLAMRSWFQQIGFVLQSDMGL
jgi:hypothetical protein